MVNKLAELLGDHDEPDGSVMTHTIEGQYGVGQGEDWMAQRLHYSYSGDDYIAHVWIDGDHARVKLTADETTWTLPYDRVDGAWQSSDGLLTELTDCVKVLLSPPLTPGYEKAVKDGFESRFWRYMAQRYKATALDAEGEVDSMRKRLNAATTARQRLEKDVERLQSELDKPETEVVSTGHEMVFSEKRVTYGGQPGIMRLSFHPAVTEHTPQEHTVFVTDETEQMIVEPEPVDEEESQFSLMIRMLKANQYVPQAYRFSKDEIKGISKAEIAVNAQRAAASVRSNIRKTSFYGSN